MLNQYLASVTDIRFLTPAEKDLDMNIVWTGRNASYLALKTFLDKVNLLGQKTSTSKDSWE